MSQRFKFLIFFIIIFLSFSSIHGFELKPLKSVDSLTWTLETTFGWQNITNVLVSKEDGASTRVNRGLLFKGILFHSFWNGIQTLKSQLNLGFNQRTHFLWTDSPDFFHGDMRLNENLECIEFDIQGLFPYRLLYTLTISPYVGYSFIDYSLNEPEFKNYKNNIMYNSLILGVGCQHKIIKNISHVIFFSYSPIVFENYSKSKMQFINYGYELITETHPISLTFFVVYKKAFLQRGEVIFEGANFKFTNAETGFAMHINLR